MTPTGLAQIIVFPGATKPNSGVSDCVLSKEPLPANAKTPPIVRIDGQARADRTFAMMLRQKGNVVSVLLAGERTISVICELPPGSVIDRSAAFADPVIEIAGREKRFARCVVEDIKLGSCYIEILIRPSTAYVLNWNEGAEHSLSSIRVVKVHMSNGPSVELINQFYDPGTPLHLGTEESSSR